jgi:hypothetical protein
MTTYDITIISTTGFPYFTKLIKEIPENVRVYLRFFDFSHEVEEELEIEGMFELTAGLVSAMFEFSRTINKKIFMLEFQSKIEQKEKQNIDGKDAEGNTISETLITCSSEKYLIYDSLREKIKLIYNTIVIPKIPLMIADPLLTPEIDRIVEIIDDVKARNNFLKFQEDIKNTSKELLAEMTNHGLEDICISTFDLSPIETLGDKYSLEDIEEILRNLPQISEIPPSEWIYRQSSYKKKEIWVYIGNSGVGITEEHLGEKIFEPYYYLLISKFESYLGDFPAKLTQKFNEIFSK